MCACARRAADALASLLFVGAPALPRPVRNLRAVPLREPSIPRPGRDRRSTWGVESLASFALGHLVVLALDRRQCPCSPRKRRGRRGDRRPSLRTQTLRRLGAARLVFGGCPITGAQSSRHAPCAAATVRRRRCAVRCSRRATAAPGAREPVRTPARVKEHGLALRRDGQEGRELPRLSICVG